MPMHEDAPCQFLNRFPPELRLMVYEHLLVRSRPVTFAKSQHEEEAGEKLDLEILKVNRQIHDEAAAVFYGKNTLRIKPKVVTGKFETIASRYRHLVRNLSVEVLHCPSGPTYGWEKTDSDAPAHNREIESYSMSPSLPTRQTITSSQPRFGLTPPQYPH